ncbi:MAG: HI0074 family nucleotidyltransferase substrate-binding subunit [Acidobacteriota bacterium]|nr:HI0074 family nucleotidyltransferase substrate-binding subunit [Acidobacteriota bacterium]
MKLDYSSLERAVAQLQKSFDYLHSDLARKDAGLREQFRAATIQAFEFSYELAIKMIRRQLAQIVANPDELKQIDYADLMRDAADAGIVRDVSAYLRYREMRNKTSHTYNVDRAEKTVAAMDEFLRDVRFLLKELERRNRAAD